MGRHSHPDDLLGDEQTPSVVPAVDAKGRTSAIADLQLVLHSPRLLRWCLVMTIVPFAVYFAVMVLTGRMSQWPLFVGVPLVAAGILVGAVVDREYARNAR